MKKGALDERLDTYLWLLSTIVIRASFPKWDFHLRCNLRCYSRNHNYGIKKAFHGVLFY